MLHSPPLNELQPWETPAGLCHVGLEFTCPLGHRYLRRHDAENADAPVGLGPSWCRWQERDA